MDGFERVAASLRHHERRPLYVRYAGGQPYPGGDIASCVYCFRFAQARFRFHRCQT